MPEKFSLKFSDYFEGVDPGQFGISPQAADHLVIFCQRVQRSDEFELVRCGRAQRLSEHRRPAAIVEFKSRRNLWRLVASADPGPMLQLRFKPILAEGRKSEWIQPYYSLDYDLCRIDEAWGFIEHYERAAP